MQNVSVKRKSGATLVEVVFAIMILAFLAMAAIMTLRNPRFQAVTTTHHQAAVHAANSAMEGALSMGYMSPEMAVGNYSLAGLFDQYSMHNMHLSGTRSVEVVNALKRITISVDYPGSDEPVILQTLISP